MSAGSRAAEVRYAEPLVVRVQGGPRERGRQYGALARERVRASLAAYAEVYAKFGGLTWAGATGLARTFVPALERFEAAAVPGGAGYLEEMRGIAEGAGVAFEDVLALNLRTEILFSGKARTIAAAGRAPGGRPPAECTSFCDLRGPEPIVGQNWDWIPFSHGTVVVLESDPDRGPRWVSVVEAGLLAKFGMNAAGLTVLTNALVTSRDVGDTGVPYHLMLRALLDAPSLAAGERLISSATRSSSANYLLVEGDRAVDAETRPGGAAEVHRTPVERGGFLVHANHFHGGDGDFGAPGEDLGPRVMPDSPFRRGRAEHGAELMPEPSLAGWHEVLSDHENFPDSLCCHPDATQHPLEQGSTVASAVFLPARREMHLALGHPCTVPRIRYDYGEFLAG
ncbi:C45 family peptidase [Streptomyces sp. NPDC049906]|uniref:C45 family peptidase n=1 Tax=Streptomyces sp. NPDC049906 TaxID=3155656 RepID=UPI003435DF68